MAQLTEKQIMRALQSVFILVEDAPGEYSAELEIPGGYTLGDLNNIFKNTDVWDALPSLEKGEVLYALVRLLAAAIMILSED